MSKIQKFMQLKNVGIHITILQIPLKINILKWSYKKPFRNLWG